LTIEKRLPWFNRYENFIKKVSAVFFISLVASYAIMPTIANQQKTTICNKEYVDSKNNTDKDDVGFNLTNNYAIANYDENIALECNKCLQGNKNVDNQALPRCDVCQMVANYYEDTSGNLECRRCTQGEQQMLALQDQDNDRQAEYVCLVCKEKRTDAEEVEM
jgi:hypothetical protein